MSPSNSTTATQDRIIESIRSSQEATVEACRSWAKTFTTVTPTMFEAFPPRFDNYVGFAEKLWSAQRDFSTNLFEAAAELGRALPDTAKRATAAAENARTTASKS